jgi:hypothetical protein
MFIDLRLSSPGSSVEAASNIPLLRNKKLSPLESTLAFLVSSLYLRAKHVEELLRSWLLKMSSLL